MPDLREMLGKAREEEAQRAKRKITKGIRPDRILRGEIQFGDNGQILSQSESSPTDITEAKSSSNRGQTEAKPGTELRPNRVQIEAITTNKKDSNTTNRGQTEAKPGTELRPLPRPNRGQTEAKPGTEPRPTEPIYSLDGLQRQILLLIFDHCKKARDKQTPPIAVQHITENCKTTYHAARKAIQRLEQKGVLKRAEFKVGRSGWTRYEIPNLSYQEILQCETEAKLRPIRGQTEGKPGTELRPEPRPSVSSSSSSLDLDLNKLTNTGDLDISGELPLGWNEIDTSPLSAVRFGRHQLAQLVRVGTLSCDQVQESINAFAFDLEVNGKSREINGHALNYFMGILRKGPYAPPTNYEAPEVRQMRLYLEAKEREQKARVELETRLETIEFDEWVAVLTVAERAQLVPATDFAKPGSTGHNVQLKQYFREKVWPERRERILSKRSLNDGDRA